MICCDCITYLTFMYLLMISAGLWTKSHPCFLLVTYKRRKFSLSLFKKSSRGQEAGRKLDQHGSLPALMEGEGGKSKGILPLLLPWANFFFRAREARKDERAK